MRGSIQKRPGPQGAAYRARVEYPADPVTGKRRQRSETFKTKREAETALSKWLAEIERGTAVDTTKQTVGEFLRHWLETVARHRVRPTTFEDYEATIDNHIIPALGSIPIQRLTAANVQGFYAAKLSSGSGARTVQLCHMRLSQALAQGVRWGTVARNVCEAVDPPKVTTKKGKTWTPDEARRFLAAAEADGYSPLWLVALTTGARQGELLGLRWQDVDLVKGSLSIRQSLAMLDGKPVIQAPKSRAAVRTIGLPIETVAALKAHKARQNEERLKAGPAWADHDLVFTTPTGNPIHPSNVLRNYVKLQERAGVPRIRFHDLRHTHATWLITGGQPITSVSERLGHAKSSITLDVYAHAVAATRDGAALAVSALLFGDDDTTAAEVGS
jgi:integrase